MHELSLAQALVERVQELVAAEGAARVLRVTVTIGALSGVEPEAFELAFPVACEGTALAGAELVMQLVPSVVYCRSCGRESQPAPPALACELCGGLDFEVRAGRDFLLRAVEVE